MAKVHNYVFYGTDTFRSAYQNWKNGAPAAFGSSVKALAHRIVQGFEKEFDCYQNMFDTAQPGEFLSMVGDCYDYGTRTLFGSYVAPTALYTIPASLAIRDPKHNELLKIYPMDLSTIRGGRGLLAHLQGTTSGIEPRDDAWGYGQGKTFRTKTVLQKTYDVTFHKVIMP